MIPVKVDYSLGSRVYASFQLVMSSNRNAKLLGKLPELIGKSNYVTWAEDMMLAFQANQMAVPLTTPLSTSASEAELQADLTARATLLLSCSKNVKDSLKKHQTAKEVWDAAKKKYGTPSPLMIASLMSQLYGMHLLPSEDIESFLSKKASQILLLANGGTTVSEPDVVALIMVLVKGQFESLIESLESKMSSLTLEDLESRLLAAQEARQSSKGPGEQAKFGRVTNRTCSFCKKSGHVEAKCWLKNPNSIPIRTRNTSRTKPSICIK